MNTAHLNQGLSGLRVNELDKRVRLGMRGKAEKILIDPMMGSPDNL